MRVVVLGGSGFLGTSLVQQLRGSGDYEVVTVSRSMTADVRADLRSPSSVQRVLSNVKPQRIVNLVSGGLTARDPTSWPVDLEILDVQLPLELLDWAAVDPSTRVVLTATSALHQRPNESAYARMKAQGRASLLARLADYGNGGTNCRLLNLHNVYGQGQPAERFIAAVVSASLQRKPFRVAFPRRCRDFVTVEDACLTISRALADETPGIHEVEIGTGLATSLIDAATAVTRAFGLDLDLIHAGDSLEADVLMAEFKGGTYGTCTTSLDSGLLALANERRVLD